MPNIKSAQKRMRQNTIRRLRNRVQKSQMRTEIKRFRKLVESNQLDQASSSLPTVYSVIDQTVQKGAIHRNTGARYKSRLGRLLLAQQNDT